MWIPLGRTGPVEPAKREMYFSTIYRMGKSARAHMDCLVRG